MKTINNYIIEKLHVTKNLVKTYNPQSRGELLDNILEVVDKNGPTADLSVINVKEITDMSYVFNTDELLDFNGDVSSWDVSNVTNMEGMFYNCKKFDGDLSKWNTSKLDNASYMFAICTKFTGKGLKNWNVEKLYKATEMFADCGQFKEDLSNWNPKNLQDACGMFSGCYSFKCDLNGWKPNFYNINDAEDMFKDADKINPLPKWYYDLLNK